MTGDGIPKHPERSVKQGRAATARKRPRIWLSFKPGAIVIYGICIAVVVSGLFPYGWQGW